MRVLYEDNHLIAVLKPSGVLVHGDKSGRPTLDEQVREWLREKYEKPGNVFLGVVHRLDREVSGVVVFAKTSKGASRLSEQIRDREVGKSYAAVVEGTMPEVRGELTHWLRRRGYGVRVVKPRTYAAKEARLRYEVAETRGAYQLLQIELITGRKHQIRAQLAAMGCPIRGDSRYGARSELKEGGMALMCWRMEFDHPTQEQRVTVEVPAGELPFQEWLR